jgi:hypothetical protein
MNSLDRVARIWSDVLNPLYLSPPLFVVCGWLQGGDPFSLGVAFGISAVCLTLAPLLYLIHLSKAGRIEGFDVLNRRDRPSIYIFSLTCYVAAISLFAFADIAPKGLYLFICLLYVANTLIFFGINQWTKISVHSASIATVLALIVSFMPIHASEWLLPSVLTSTGMVGLMMWSRVRLKCHTVGQVFGGASLGMMLTLLERYWIYPTWFV